MSELFVPMAVLVALVLKLTDLFKYAKNRDVNGAATIAFVWVAGFIGVWLFAGSAWADGLVFGEQRLDQLNLQSLVLVGFAIGSSAGVVFDFKKALDNSDSAAVPSLLDPALPAVNPPPVGMDAR